MIQPASIRSCHVGIHCLTLCLFTAVVMSTHADSETPTISKSERRSATPDDGQFVVHEWGTFTSYSGSDGVRLDFRPLVENDLPDFVYDWLRWTGMDIFIKKTLRARQRMETPITYFYTDRVREVNVKVGFPQGVLTEFYPPVRRLEPQHIISRGNSRNLSAEELRGGLLDWGRVTLIPQASLRPDLKDRKLADAVAQRAFESLPPGGDPEPELYTGDHYFFARNTAAALVHVHLEPQQVASGSTVAAWNAPHGDFFEKFLFYRGVGNFALPLTVASRPDGRFDISNQGSDPLTGLLFLEVRNGEVRFSRLDDLARKTIREVGAPPEFFADTEGQSVHGGLWQAMHAILCEQGLYQDEANAMLQTWQHSWFLEEGTRLLYIVPRPRTDEILPLTIDPAPQQTIRVLVGRLEILPAAEEQRLIEVVRSSRRDRAVTKAASGVPAELLRLGRFAEPALVRLAHVARDDAEVREEAASLLCLIRSKEFAADDGQP
ncbi:MAG: hypothetical protein KDA75_13900 [Planctomycetaceae bacterium]|nr:hypothetical protein [Planctomycetaceae bacterium]